MDPSALLSELRAAGLSEIDISTRRRAEYSGDASLYRVAPTAVAFPRSTDEVLAAVATCRTLGVPITARGAGTSIAGNAVGSGLVLDFARHLNRITALDPESGTAVVQPGVILDDLQRAAAPHGLRFGPDPSTHSRCTLGGMIGNNACGSRALGYGRTADNVAALDLVAGNGERINAVPGARTSPTLARLYDLVLSEIALIRTELGRFTRQVSGYSLEHLLPERGFHVPAALVGTEGSCGVLLGATVKLRRAPASTALVVLGYPDMATAADAVPALLPHHPIAVEGLDSRMLDVLPSLASVPELPIGKGWLFVELDTTHTRDAIEAVLADAGTPSARVVDNRAEAAALWRIREDGAGLAARANNGHAGWEDAAVPPERLGAYLREFESLLTDYRLTGTPYGHFGDGCVHIRIDFPLGTPVFREFLTDAAKLVASYGGSCSGEHGDGRARGELLPLMYSREAIDLFARVKAIFDPDNLLNPGIVVRPDPVDAHLRIQPAHRPSGRLALRFAHDNGDFGAAVHRCTGVGKCRADNTANGGVMCPSYLATRDEKDSTRGRARVLQDMLDGSLIRGGWRAPEVREALDLCLSCKGCASDCPTGIDMAAYKAEVLHQAYRHRPRPMAHYTLGALPRWARIASGAPGIANAAMRFPGVAALGKLLAGVDPRRELPRFANRTFQQIFERHQRAQGDPVLLWVDTFTNHFTPEVGVAAVRVLESAGYSVRIQQPGLCCGLTWISTGQLDAAKRILGRTVAALPTDMPIVGLEPSCTAVFRSEAPELLDTHVPRVATLAELLADRPQWNPPDLSGLDVLAQPHCHQHAVLGFTADRDLLAGAGANLTALGGCCGLAGNFGVERGHYDVSVAVAEHTLLPAVRAAQSATEVLADGFSCRTQLAELSDRRGRHLAELLASRL
ncbi:MAG TPA: FAD-linked oxidase C-terminal domain-containing protein [Pseudonocardiaceae bacterium]|jgi:FAD/FMN-containing dehydrogenase/Fe-S oxidoreductase